MKRHLPRAIVLVAIVTAALLLRYRRPGGSAVSSLPATPEKCVNALFDAAGRGDDEAYLALLGGELRDTLRAVRDRDRRAFRDELRRSADGILGLAVTRAEQPVDDGEAALDVELVFADRNERQRIVLREVGGGWAVVSLGPASTTRPAVPYGTPVYQE